MSVVFIGVGSNLGDRSENIRKALGCLKDIQGVVVEKASALVDNRPYKATGPNYLNGVVKIKTDSSPGELLNLLQQIEKKLGRQRSFPNAPRIIDLDILLYDNLVVDQPNLKIPHPRMGERDFVMIPLLEVEPKILENTSALAKQIKKNDC